MNRRTNQTVSCFALAMVLPALLAAGEPNQISYSTQTSPVPVLVYPSQRPLFQAEVVGEFEQAKPYASPVYRGQHSDPWHSKVGSGNLLRTLDRMRQRRALSQAIRQRHKQPANTHFTSYDSHGYAPRQIHPPSMMPSTPRLPTGDRVTVPGVASTSVFSVPELSANQEVTVPVPLTALQIPDQEPLETGNPQATPPLPAPERIESPVPAADVEHDAFARPSEMPAAIPNDGALLQPYWEPVEPIYGPFSTCQRCRLTVWERILRCVRPKHRCIPLRHPEEAAFPYYQSTRWHRSPADMQSSWMPAEVPEPEVAPDIPVDEQALPIDAPEAPLNGQESGESTAPVP